MDPPPRWGGDLGLEVVASPQSPSSLSLSPPLPPLPARPADALAPRAAPSGARARRARRRRAVPSRVRGAETSQSHAFGNARRERVVAEEDVGGEAVRAAVRQTSTFGPYRGWRSALHDDATRRAGQQQQKHPGLLRSARSAADSEVYAFQKGAPAAPPCFAIPPLPRFCFAI